MIKKDDHPKNYFILKRHSKCTIHNSNICSCKLNITEKEFQDEIRKSINFYKICSTFYEIINGKLVYISVKTKIDIINLDNSEDIKEDQNG